MHTKFKTLRDWRCALVAVPALGLFSATAFGQAEVSGQTAATSTDFRKRPTRCLHEVGHCVLRTTVVHCVLRTTVGYCVLRTTVVHCVLRTTVGYCVLPACQAELRPAVHSKFA